MIHGNDNPEIDDQAPRDGGPVIKLCGGDIELGNAVIGLPGRRDGTCGLAASALLRQINGVSHGGASPSGHSSYGSSYSLAGNGAIHTPYGSWNATGMAGNYDPRNRDGRDERDERDDDASGCGCGYDSTYAYGGKQGGYDPQDHGRRFLAANGGCAYIDLNHLELCLPEVLSATDHLCAWHAMLRIAQDALARANAQMPEGKRIVAFVNNSDGSGNSYGSHLNVMTTRRCWEDIFHRRLHHLLCLASHFVSSIVYTGAGKVGSENGRAPVDYQIAQRADFFEALTGMQTTYHRPIVNSRDEGLCGPSAAWRRTASLDDSLARLHVIFYDNTLCHVASFLKVGVTQIVLAMLEQDWAFPGLILDNPVDAVVRYSHDPGLVAKAPLVCGRKFTAVEHQRAVCQEAARFVDQGRAKGVVPQAEDILAMWDQTLTELEHGQVEALAGKIDWVLKRCILQHVTAERKLAWNSPQLKHLDLLYSSLDPGEGLYWAYERAGTVHRLVTDADIERLVHEPPPDTRAHLRAAALRRIPRADVLRIDWDEIRFRVKRPGRDAWSTYDYYDLPMHDPRAGTQRQVEGVFEQADSLVEALERFGLRDGSSEASSSRGGKAAPTTALAVRPDRSVRSDRSD